jgi:hypothetical protein
MNVEHAPEHVDGPSSPSQHAPEHVGPRAHTVAPHTAYCQLTVRRSTREKLRYAEALLSHAIPSGDLSTCSTERWIC